LLPPAHAYGILSRPILRAAELPYSTGAPQAFALRHASGLISAFEIFLGFFECHDVRVFVMEIEEVDLMRQRAAVKDTFSTTVT
jgi:hypothetical protein